MDSNLDVVKNGVDKILAQQAEVKAAQVVAEEARKQQADALTALHDQGKTTAKWMEDVEARLASARQTVGGTASGDMLLQAIPEERRGLVGKFARCDNSKLTSDPVRAAAFAIWLQNAAKLQLRGYSEEWPVLHDQNKALELALHNGVVVKADTLTGAAGGYTVPQPLEAEVLRQLQDASVVRRLARSVPMDSKTLDFPGGTNAVTCAITVEGGAISASEEVFTTIQLLSRKFASYSTATVELLDDSAIGILTYWLELATEQMALLEDQQALEGDGTTDQFTGVLIGTDVNEVAYLNTVAVPTLVKEIADVKFAGNSHSRRNAAWIMRSSAMGFLVGAQDAAGAPFLNQASIGWVISQQLGAGTGMGEGTMLGDPVWTSDEIAEATLVSTIYYGNWRDGMMYGDRTGITFGVSEHENFQADLISMKMTKRTAIVIAVPQYLTRWVDVDITPPAT